MMPRSPERVAELTARVAALAPLVHDRRTAFDRDRRLPADVFDAIAAAGLLRLWLPRTLGGPELCPLDFMEVVDAAAGLDGSVGWIVGNGAGMSRVAGYLPEGIVRDWFADPGCFVASATGAVGSAVPGAGGFRVSGRWPLASGIHRATRVMALCAVAGPDAGEPPRRLCCYLAAGDVEIVDGWHVSGLRGTDSCDFQVHDVLVPDAQVHDFPLHRPTQPGLVYRLPLLSAFSWTVAVVPLGIARAAIAAFVALAATRSRPGAGGTLRDQEAAQIEVGRAEAALAAGRALLVGAMTELMAATDLGGDRLLAARARLRAAAAHAAESAVAVVDRLSAAAGAAAIFEAAGIERRVRDVHAAVRHVAMAPASYVASGRLALGLDTTGVRF